MADLSERKPRVLVACEFSGRVSQALRNNNVEAWSVDLEPTEGDPNYHIVGDALEIANSQHWDGLIAFPPCTHLAVSGARWWKDKNPSLQERALKFVLDLMALPINKKCIENPVSIISSRIRRPTQIIQPWQFGHGEVKTTCLWLENLPLLKPTKIHPFRNPAVHYARPGPDRWKNRSRTYQGIADAMGAQWSF